MSAAVVGRQVLMDAIATLLHSGLYTVHAYTNDYDPVVDSLPTSFVEASYDSYPVGGIVPPFPTFGGSGNEVAMSTVGVRFPAPIADGPVQLFGVYVLFQPSWIAVGPSVLLAMRFRSSPQTLVNGGSDLPVVIDFNALDVNNP